MAQGSNDMSGEQEKSPISAASGTAPDTAVVPDAVRGSTPATEDKKSESLSLTTPTPTSPEGQAIKDPGPSPLPTPASRTASRTTSHAGSVEDGNESSSPEAGPGASSSGGGRLGPRPAVFRSTFHEVAFVFQATVATMSSTFLVGVTTIVTASIGRDLAMTQGEITWISASTSLTAGAFQLALGQLADLLGRRPLFIAGMASFAAFALLAGFARNPFWMDVVCGCLGLSAAMMVPPAIGILGAAYGAPSRRKNIAFSAFSAGNPLGFAMGSTFGGIAARLFDWRASLFLVAILWGVFAAASFWAVPSGVEAYDPRETVGVRMAGFFARFDSVGAVLTLFGTGMFTAAITLGPDDGWGSATVVSLLVVGVVLLVGFGFWERHWPHPLMPPKIWNDRNFTLLMISLLLGFMSFNSCSFWLAFFMQKVQNRDALDVAVHLLPQAIGGLIWNVVAGATLHLVNNTLLHGIGAVAYLASSLLLSFMGPDSNYWAFVFPSLIVSVIGADFQFNVVNMYVMQSLPSHQQALAGGIFNTLIRLCQTLALGISTAVYSSIERTAEGAADPMLKFTRAFQVSIALSAAGILFVPFIRLGTQGNVGKSEVNDQDEDTTDSPGPVIEARTR